MKKSKPQTSGTVTMPSGKAALGRFAEALRLYDHYLLSCHVSPEGDAIGSILAMESLLRRLGKKTTVVCEDPFPERLSCLKTKRWHQVHEVARKNPSFDALVVADCPVLERIGNARLLLKPSTVIFNIDHHFTNRLFGDHNYVCPQAAASGEVVMELFRYFKMPFTKEDAKNLYVAISTDTGSFKYGNTTVRTLQDAAELVKVGIDLEKINEDVYATYSLNKIQLYSRLLGRVKTSAQGRIAWAMMTREDLHHSGATDEDAEGFIDFLKYIREVKVAFFLSEMPREREVRVSFRSKEPYDVYLVATSLGGGGHRKAAGCTIHGTLEDAEKNVLHAVRKEFSLS